LPNEDDIQHEADPVADEFARIGGALSNLLARGTAETPSVGVTSASPIALETHRNHHVFSLGGPLYADGFRRGDADALMGLLSLPAAAAIASLAPHSCRATFAEALHALFANHAFFSDRGRSVSVTRRWEAYRRELESWRRVDAETRCNGAWRSKEMSETQRHLVRVTAVHLEILIPIEMNRGQAADWLERHGANLNYPEM
jgi:hypothetical protein